MDSNGARTKDEGGVRDSRWCELFGKFFVDSRVDSASDLGRGGWSGDVGVVEFEQKGHDWYGNKGFYEGGTDPKGDIVCSQRVSR